MINHIIYTHAKSACGQGNGSEKVRLWGNPALLEKYLMRDGSRATLYEDMW